LADNDEDARAQRQRALLHKIFQNGELLAACRFTVRALAVHWAEQKRAAILRSGGV
jgi:hypothetical protein